VISKLAGVGAPAAFLHLPTVLLPLSFVLVYEAGTALFASRWAGVARSSTRIAVLILVGATPPSSCVLRFTSLETTATIERPSRATPFT
jgi:hypothetical protein